jgi:hypothetical protein
MTTPGRILERRVEMLPNVQKAAMRWMTQNIAALPMA